MKDKMLVRIVLVILGSAVMGLSINLLVAAGFGLDPLSLFQAGLCNVFHISLGQASQLLMTGIIIILFFLDRKRIGIGSILNSILVGAFVNFFAAGFPAGGPCAPLGQAAQRSRRIFIYGYGNRDLYIRQAGRSRNRCHDDVFYGQIPVFTQEYKNNTGCPVSSIRLYLRGLPGLGNSHIHGSQRSYHTGYRSYHEAIDKN